MDAKMRAEADQAAETLAEYFATTWRALFTRLVDSGFTEHQAMELTKSYIEHVSAKMLKNGGSAT
jgi:hypothetical protein